MSTPSRPRRSVLRVALALSAALVAAGLLALVSGPFPLGASDVLRALVLEPFGLRGASLDEQARIVVFELRLPRIVLALFVGAALGSAGGAAQGLFRNPLADPGLLGVSSGASLGAALAIVALGPLLLAAPPIVRPLALPLAAFVGAALVSLLVARIGRREAEPGHSELLLAGIAINAIAGASVGLLSQLADDAQLRDLVYWTLGGLDRTQWVHVLVAAPWIALGVALAASRALALDALALGEREAGYLGVDVARNERIVGLAMTVAVGAAVSVSGLIGFVGLVVPHLARRLVGPMHRGVLVVAPLLGALLVLVADTIARTVAPPTELPVGLLTAMVGGPFFLSLIARRRSST